MVSRMVRFICWVLSIIRVSSIAVVIGVVESSTALLVSKVPIFCT